MTLTWDADYTFTGCVGFEGEFCASLERTHSVFGAHGSHEVPAGASRPAARAPRKVPSKR